jgi:hypothetical protein
VSSVQDNACRLPCRMVVRPRVLDGHLAPHGVQRALLTAPTTPGTGRRAIKAIFVLRAEEAPVPRNGFRIDELPQLGRVGMSEHGPPSLCECCAGVVVDAHNSLVVNCTESLLPCPADPRVRQWGRVCPLWPAASARKTTTDRVILVEALLDPEYTDIPLLLAVGAPLGTSVPTRDLWEDWTIEEGPVGRGEGIRPRACC